MKGIDLSHANTATIAPSAGWLSMDAGKQTNAISRFLEDCEYSSATLVKFVSPSELVIAIERGMNAAQRGEFLRKLEAEIKQHIDESISLWLTPENDKNSIRKFRGVSIDVN
jgi:hypothetical protein